MNFPYKFSTLKLVFKIPRKYKNIIILFFDFLTLYISVWLSFSIRLDSWILFDINQFIVFIIGVFVYLILFIVFGCDKIILRYSYNSFIKDMAKPLLFYFIFCILLFTLFSIKSIPRTIGILHPIFFFIGLSMIRFAIERIYSLVFAEFNFKPNSYFIYGAGNSGRQLCKALIVSSSQKVYGFIDDDIRLQGHTIDGLKVYSINDLPFLVKKFNLSNLLIAISNLSSEKRNQIYKQAIAANIKISFTPTLLDIVSGKFNKNEIISYEIDQLLGRSVVDPSHYLLLNSIKGKSIIITGAGGSIGSELCRQIINFEPSKLILIENNEFSLYAIYEELKLVNINNIELVPLLCSVQDRSEITRIFKLWCPDVIFHAAAFKHVPLIEYNQAAGFLNNAMGTLVCAEAAISVSVKNFILVSTDKAVRPTNMLGASKRIAEMIVQALHCLHPDVKFSIVRFGNVLGSSGSVVPLFQKQIDHGGPVTVTHPDVMRYFMSIPEAAQLIIQAASISAGGEVFVLDMGKPVKIFDLAKKMIEINGADPNSIHIKILGLRHGEKLFEELVIDGTKKETVHPKIFNINEKFLPWNELEPILIEIQKKLIENKIGEVLDYLKNIVNGFNPYPISDLRYLKANKLSRNL